MKKILFFLALFSALNADSKSYSFYTDGVYDAYSVIENNLRSGLKKEEIQSFSDKWLVSKDVSSESTVQIIFLQTIAHKNNFFNAIIAKKNSSGKSYLIFGTYTRKADAEFAQKKILESGIETDVVFASRKESYSQNPIVVQKIVEDMKGVLTDVPVLIIKQTEVVSSGGERNSKVNVTPQKCTPSIIEKPVYIQKDVSEELTNISREQIFALRTLFKDRGRIDADSKSVFFKERSGHVNKYKELDFFKSFKITQIYRDHKGGIDGIKLLAIDGKTYEIQKKITYYSASQKKQTADAEKIVNAHGATPPPPPLVPKKDTKGTNSYKCDFSKIPIAKDESGKKIMVKNTHYGTQKISVDVSKKGADYEVKYPAYPPISVNGHYFAKGCEKQ